MSFEEEFRSLLLVSPIANLGVLPGQVNWGEHPQGASYPALVLNWVSGAEGYTQQGRDGLTSARIQIDCYGFTYGIVRDLRRALEGFLGGYRAGRFSGIFLLTVRVSREGGSNEAARPYRASMDFQIYWRAS